MARAVAVAIENNFVKGLQTEATGLNFPENSCISTENCEFDILGKVTRRLGMNYEDGNTLKTIDRTQSVIGSYLWRNVTGDGTVSFAVHQIGNKLYFYNTTNLALSTGAETSTIDMTTYQTGTIEPRQYECQFSDGIGKLFVVHPYLEPFYVTYDAVGDTFSATQVTIKIRDTTGVFENVAYDFRPTSTLAGLTAAHAYNLYNQGWNTTNLNSWDAARADMPSNADVMWLFQSGAGAFDLTNITMFTRGNTPAPRGHFILSAFNQDRTTASGVAGITTVTTGGARPSSVAFFAGRIWYSGVNYVGFNSKIYFSQIIEADRTDQFGYCYQANDMTDEDLFDIEVNDGGVIQIPEAGTIVKLFPMQSALIVFAQRGVFAITGSTGIGFTATDYTITKLSNYRTVSGTSFVEVNNAPIWWTNDGIFTVVANGGGLAVQSISFTTIQSFYNSIPGASKIYARGYFSQVEQVVRWLYRSTDAVSIQQAYEFDSMLTYNVLTGSFSPSSFDTTNVKIHGVLVPDATSGSIIEATVLDAASDIIIDAAGETVVCYQVSTAVVDPAFKFLVSKVNGATYDFTYAELNDDRYVDFYDFDSAGSNYSSYFITGYKVHGDAQRRFQANYVYLYHEGTGECIIQGIWDYAITTGTGKYTPRQLLTFSDGNYANNKHRIKMRGAGKSLQYFVQSVAGQPFSIIGWSAWETGNAQP